jgi:hypothetical protein
MPEINPNLVPTITPGNLFDRFTEDTTLNVRWLTAGDPVFFEATNRPMADITLRQLILAKAIDDLNTSLGAAAIFPFIIQPQVTDGSNVANVPIRIFWDMHASASTRWANIRLARIDRLDGINPTSGGSEAASGTIRFVFTGQEASGGVTGSSEIAVFFADYEIDSTLKFQRVDLTPANGTDVPNLTVLDSGETGSVGGNLVFRTQDPTDAEMDAFLDVIVPGTSAFYDVVDSDGEGSDGDFDALPISHGTGMLTSSAVNVILPLNNDPELWIDAFNFPFSIDATMTSTDFSGIIIPTGLFREMDMTAPAGDAPTGDSSGTLFPVWINRIESDGSTSVPTLTLYFATHGIEPVDPTTMIEFGSVVLSSDMVPGQVVNIIPESNLFPDATGNGWSQDFGRGHVTLSGIWSITGGEVDAFFTNFPVIVGSDASANFNLAGTRVAQWGLSRIPKWSPTEGQAAALRGTSSNNATPVHPGSTNRFVVELDEGFGDSVNLDDQSGISAHPSINKFGNQASRSHSLINLPVDSSSASDTADPTFYDTELLPRIRLLLGRDPIFGDIWYNGNRFVTFNGDAWVD